MEKRLQNRHLLLGITGSIAAYKSCTILRMLQREGASLRVVMTRAAQQFVRPLTFETLSGSEVFCDLFSDRRIMRVQHVRLAEWAECILVCPATANIIGKVASGIADDFLSTIIMASRSPVIFAPAMDSQMVENPIYGDNCKKLQSLNYHFIAPETGALASGAEGKGRLAEDVHIIESVKSVFLGSDRLKGVKVLVSAGPTQEPLDPVRFLSNQSSGKMGYAVAEEALLRGAEVTLVSGPTGLHPFSGVHLINVRTAKEMTNVICEAWKDHQILIMAAAVADYRPSKPSPQKIKKSDSAWMLKMERTDDILAKVTAHSSKGIVVGFALEMEKGEERAFQKLKQKKLDLICLNNPYESGAGFGDDNNRVTLIDREGKKEALPLMPKWQVAQCILDKVEGLLKHN